jgi:MFS transporter, DHA1 family, inner membrane transport protein
MGNMATFKNTNINWMYAHAGIQSLATNSGSVFIFAYLLKAGIALPVVFLIIAITVSMRLILRMLVLPLIFKMGLRTSLLIGTVLDASSFLVLGHIHSVSPLLIFYVVLSSLGTTFYWTCYHAMVSKLGDEEHRGAQVSAREAIYALTGIAGPLFGGLMLTYVGPIAAFLASAMVYGLSALPLLKLEEIPLEQNVGLQVSEKIFASGLAFSDGLVAASVNFLWRIVLFKSLGENFDAFGGALAVASIAGALMGLVAGHFIDLGHNKRSYQIGIAAMAITILTEAFGFQTAWGALAATMLSALIVPIYMSSIMAPIYNAGQKSACPLRFNAMAENGFDSGASLGCLLAALLTWQGFGFFLPLLVGLLGCVGCYTILRWHFKQA